MRRCVVQDGGERVRDIISGDRRCLAVTEWQAQLVHVAHWRGTIRYAIVGLTVGTDGAFDVELIEDAFD